LISTRARQPDNDWLQCGAAGAAFNADRFRHRLAASAAELTPVRHRALDEIDKNPAKLWLVALAQFKMRRRHHQRHRVIRVVRQPPAGRQNR